MLGKSVQRAIAGWASGTLLLGILVAAPSLEAKPVLPVLEDGRGTSVPTWNEQLPGPGRGLHSTAAQETTWFGGTVWAADSMRWEAIPGGIWTFDSGVGSHFDHSADGVNPYKDPSLHAYMEGWVGLDFTYSEIPFFRRLTTDDFGIGPACVGSTVGLGGSASLYAGVTTAEAESLCYLGGQGYGSSWNVCVEREFTTDGSASVAWSFDYVADTEPGFDYAYALVDTTGNDDDVQVWSSTGVAAGAPNLTLDPGSSMRSDAGAFTLKYCLVSDGAYDDEDGFYDTSCGGLAVDDVQVTGAGVAYSADFEGGPQGWSLSPSRPGPGGDWTHLRHLSTLPPMVSQVSCQSSCGVSDSVLVFADLTLVPGGHNSFQDNQAVSPWIDLRASGLSDSPGALVSMDGYWELPVLNYVFSDINMQYYPYQCPITGTTRVSPWIDDGLVIFFGSVPYCSQVPWVSKVGHMIPGAEQVRVGIRVFSYCRFFTNCTGQTNTSPWFDNVRFGVYGNPDAPIITTSIDDTPQDAFPENGTLALDAPGRIDCNNVIRPDAYSSLGDTLIVSGATDAPSEVRVVFAVDPGPGVDWVRLGNWLTSHASEGSWLGLSWFSARMDTAQSRGILWTGDWMTAYHEEDPNFSGSDSDTDPGDIDPLGNASRLLNDIFPDDLLTPGSRLCLYYKTRYVGGTSWFFLPDTSGGGYLEMEVLPSSMDGDSTFNCVLYVDHFDGRGAQPFIENALSNVLPGGSGNFENTAWDRWDVRAPAQGKASLGRPVGTEYGATALQLLGYETILWNSGNLSYQNLSQEDANVLIPWLEEGSVTRNLYLSGDGLVESIESDAPQNPRAIELLHRYLGTELVCDAFRYPNCAGAEDTVSCVTLDPTVGAPVAGGRSSTHLGQGNGCPQQRFFDVLGLATGALGAPAGDERYEGLVKTADFASIANTGPTWKSVIDGVSLHYRRDPADCSFDSQATAAITERLSEVFNWFGLPPGACNVNDLPLAADPRPETAPRRFALAVRSANPVFTGAMARFQLDLPREQDARVQVFDVAGRLVRTLVDDRLQAGVHEVPWDLADAAGRDVSGGVYFVRAQGSESRTQRLVVLR